MQVKLFSQGDQEYLLSLILRYKILRVPLGLTFSKSDLAKDKADVHIGMFDGDVIVASLTLTDTGNYTIKMRQVAVDDIWQGRGIGKELALYAEGHARQNDYKLIHCNARDTAKGFYLKLGYKIKGDAFTEVGIKHYYMEKAL